MIGAIIEFSARHRVLVLILVGVAAIFGYRSMQTTKLDAIPDLSDTQVIVYAKWDRSPDIIEDQLTYPITSALLGMPKVKDIRGFSDFGYSYIYIVFEEGTDIYWARSRTLEYMNAITARLPKEASIELAKDATAVGWVYQYALVDDTGQYSLEQMRSYQDWYLRYALQSLPGVAEVAPVGGFVREYQVNLDPIRLQAYKLPVNAVADAISKSNNDVGGRLVEFSGREYMVRGRGYLRSLDDIGNIVLLSNAQSGTPVRVRDVATLTYGPAMRRGVTDLNGRGEAVGGVVIMRVGENAERVIQRVKAQITLVQPSLPKGLRIVPVYDRSELIGRAVHNLRHTLIEELIIVSLVILIFLWHFPSAAIPIITIPITVMIAFIPLQLSGMTANIMSLGGIAVAIGAMVDAAIVVVEQTHKKLEHWEEGGRKEDYRRVVIDAVKEVGGPSFFALLVIAVSFMPVFALEAQEGRLFKPLALTKTLAMVIAALLAITLDPAMRLLLTRVKDFNFRPKWLARATSALLVGKIRSEEEHPISKPMMKVYQPIVEFSLEHKWIPITAALLLMAVTIPVYNKLGSEFMPPLDEGTLLYMPTTTPGISVGQASLLLHEQDRILSTFPQVQSVFGKAGRVESATDPAPFSMMETVVVLKPREQWPEQERWYTHRLPQSTHAALSHIWSDRQTTNELIYGQGGLNEALTMPGVTNAWTMPIKGRIDMLTTGVRTPLGVKVLGSNLEEIERIGHEVEQTLHSVPGTASVYAERTTGGYFLDFDLKRNALARYGLNVDDAQSVLMSAVGGQTATTTVEGRERYAVSIRYMRGYRSDLQSLERVLVQIPGGAQVPLGELATLSMRTGPGMIRDENGRLSGYVFVDVAGRDLGSYVADARRAVRAKVNVPTGYRLVWSGQYESIQRVRERLKLVLPITLFAVVLLLYANTGSAVKTGIILLAVPFSGIGAIWLLHWMGYNMSVAVWVGLIALLGVDAETAVFMLLYLDLSCAEAAARGQLSSWRQLRDAIEHGAVKRLRPKVMTVACMIFGLLPILWSNGAGADVMKRIAVPMVGGIVTSFLMELIVYPPLFAIWKWKFEVQPAMRRRIESSELAGTELDHATR
ncbi:MAG TPA: CusA/CzcA family heavy metal efflux RND transporter [Candidatus Saccharimonadales bacterium]|nr:CusA/CzcA family heavy metal efflux RND transporter [Candidatus Saccharimonadales bacterium]